MRARFFSFGRLAAWLALTALLPLFSQGQTPSDTLLWKDIRLNHPLMKALPQPIPTEPARETIEWQETPKGELYLALGSGLQHPSFNQLTQWTVDSLAYAMYSQAMPFEELLRLLEAEIGFLYEPIVYLRRASFQAEAGYRHQLLPWWQLGVLFSLGAAPLEGSTPMIAFPYDGEDEGPLLLDARLTGKSRQLAIGLETTWHLSTQRRLQPLLGLSGAWKQLWWRETHLHISGVAFALPEPSPMPALAFGLHTGLRYHPAKWNFPLEARLFYQHITSRPTKQHASIAGISLSGSLPLPFP